MDVVASVEVPVSAETLFAFISDLSNYPSWLELVHEAVPEVNSTAAKSWSVELRARLGVLPDRNDCEWFARRVTRRIKWCLSVKN